MKQGALSGSTLIETERGNVPLREVVVGDLTPFGRVAARVERGLKPVVDVTTKRGLRIRCTDNLMLASDGDFVRADESIGKNVVLSCVGLFPECPHVVEWLGFGGVEHRLTLTVEWGRFLGYFMSDGSFNGDTLSIACDKQDIDVVEDVASLVTRLFAVPHVRHTGTRGGCAEVRLSRVGFDEVFTALGIVRPLDRSNGKCVVPRRSVCVPKGIWRSSREVVREFLRALYEGDGWRCQRDNSIKFFAKDAEFCRDLQRLLLRFDVSTTVREVVKHNRERSYRGCELVTYTAGVPKFVQTIGFCSARKMKERPRGSRGYGGRAAVIYDGHDQVVSIVAAGFEQTYDLKIDGEPQLVGNGLLVRT
jgi:hypothetical protein